MCPKLHRFWQSIFETSSKICGRTTHPSPLISLFGVVPVDASPSGCNINMMAFCSLLARGLILLIMEGLSPSNIWSMDKRGYASYSPRKKSDTPSKVVLGNSMLLGNHSYFYLKAWQLPLKLPNCSLCTVCNPVNKLTWMMKNLLVNVLWTSHCMYPYYLCGISRRVKNVW